jgi:hypothetical protein
VEDHLNAAHTCLAQAACQQQHSALAHNSVLMSLLVVQANNDLLPVEEEGHS